MVKAATKKDQLEWCGFIESKIRTLIGILDQEKFIKLSHINPKCFHGPQQLNETMQSENQSMWFIGLEFESAVALNLDLTNIMYSFSCTVQNLAVSVFA